MSGDLECAISFFQPDRPETLALQPNRIGPLTDDQLDLIRGGNGRPIQNGPRSESIENRIPHNSTHQIDGMTPLDEELRQIGGLVDKGLNALRNHVSRR